MLHKHRSNARVEFVCCVVPFPRAAYVMCHVSCVAYVRRSGCVVFAVFAVLHTSFSFAALVRVAAISRTVAVVVVERYRQRVGIISKKGNMRKPSRRTPDPSDGLPEDGPPPSRLTVQSTGCWACYSRCYCCARYGRCCCWACFVVGDNLPPQISLEER